MNLFFYFCQKPLQKCTHINFPNFHGNQMNGVEMHNGQTDRCTFNFIQAFSGAAVKLIYKKTIRRRSISFFYLKC